MTMLKKTMLLASLALASVALAAPASASAQGTLFDNVNGTPVPTGNHVTLTMGGEIAFDIPALASSYGCLAHPKMTVVSGHPSTGTIISFNFTIGTASCAGTGLLEGCELEANETNQPDVDFEFGTYRITSNVIQRTFQEGCIVPASLLTFPTITMTPDNAEAISSVTLSGEGIDDVTELATEATGELEITGGDAGTYGIF
jgi:hypothetical protein